MMEEVVEKSLSSEMWHACAGGMVQIPLVNSKVFYFPQGHAEHSLTGVDFRDLPRIPPLILCRVACVKYLADPVTDEVFVRINLVPVGDNVWGFDEDGVLGGNGSELNEKPNSFSKTLTQSDANNGGGFSVPRYCAETIFPRLDYTADPPVQNVIARDVHGKTWKFRHIYRGTPRRHLLTTGWSSFVNHKKLVAGDSVVFLRAENGDLHIGIRRAKMGGEKCGRWNGSSLWNSGGDGNYRDNKTMCVSFNDGKLREMGGLIPESIIESAFLAANGHPFEVVYYPRASTPEFFIKASSVEVAMGVQWFSGMRFKMAFETEDSSRISWFMGTVNSVQVVDPITWPKSPWRLLQVTWDEPELLQNVKCVSPWLVEVVSNKPVLNLSPFWPPTKKMRPLHHLEFPLTCALQPLSFPRNPLWLSSPVCCQLTDSITAGVQGARHAQIRAPVSNDKLQMGLFSFPSSQLDVHAKSHDTTIQSNVTTTEDYPSLPSIGIPSQKWEKGDNVKTPQFILFGQPILTEQQLSLDDSRDTLSGYHATDLRLGSGHCKVFLESVGFGRTLELSGLGSYEELFLKLEHMFGIEKSEVQSHVFYHDATGSVKQAGDEPFSEFMKTAKRLTILKKPFSSISQSQLITGLPTAERGLDSSNQAGPLSIFA